MNDELNLGTMTLESSPKNLNRAYNQFYRLNNSGLSNKVGSATIVMNEGKLN